MPGWNRLGRNPTVNWRGSGARFLGGECVLPGLAGGAAPRAGPRHTIITGRERFEDHLRRRWPGRPLLWLGIYDHLKVAPCTGHRDVEGREFLADRAIKRVPAQLLQRGLSALCILGRVHRDRGHRKQRVALALLVAPVKHNLTRSKLPGFVELRQYHGIELKP